jgi:DNA-binding IclR family transcriptional regulator
VDQLALTFRGATYDPALDGARLGAQLQGVLRFVSSSRWYSLRQIADATGYPEASVSARLRDIRRLGFTVDRKRDGEPTLGRWLYRVNP